MAELSSIKLQASGLQKRYGAVQALKGVDLTLNAGQTHALVGSNGAGKSTLVKILTGVVVPDTGTVALDGKALTLGDPRIALNVGIACIYQHPNLVQDLSVADNIVMGRHPTRAFGILDRRAQKQWVETLLQKHNLQLDLESPVSALTSVQQKEVEIAKALSLDASVILMDEPTAALSHAEVEKLFNSIEQLCQQGVAVLYISHILDEIFRIAQQVTVLRDGQVRLSGTVSDLTKAKLVDAMLGRELTSEAAHKHTIAPELEQRPAVLECNHLSKDNVFRDVSFALHQGEILCITGLVGAKRSELMRAIFGVNPPDSGEIRVFGKQVTIRHPLDAIRLGIGFVTEDRHADGLFLNHSISTNTVIASLDLMSKAGLLLRRMMRTLAKRQIEKLEIVPAAPDYTVKNLSGGNQQKVQLGRWLVSDTKILILDEPTVGIDVGTKATIYRLLRDLTSTGTSVIIVSSDLEEVLTVADRVLVMANGRITGVFSAQQVTQEQILLAASGEIGEIVGQ
ncbi:MAG: sugar ABC transporter ATP-binding protein [Anaerolineae bacterium]|nr:sugar ABC transporter ATP-binding protein [Anaerolineae bacterium]